MFARSRYGRAVKAIRDDEIAASASGINITYMKVLVFAISAFFAGIAGGIFAQYIGSLNPAMAGWLQIDQLRDHGRVRRHGLADRFHRLRPSR